MTTVNPSQGGNPIKQPNNTQASMYAQNVKDAASVFMKAINKDGDNVLSADEQKDFMKRQVNTELDKFFDDPSILGRPKPADISSKMNMYMNGFEDISIEGKNEDEKINILTNVVNYLKACLI